MKASSVRTLVTATITALVILGALLSALPAAVTAQATVPYAALALLRSDASRYNVWRPASWQVQVSTDGRSRTTVVRPESRDARAYFVIVATDIGIDSSADRLERRIMGFDSLVHGLSNSQIQWQMQTYAGNVLAFDAQYTYQDEGNDIEAKRWVRQMYVGAWQYWLVAEASSPEEFDRLESDFLAMMVTFRPDDAVYPNSVTEGM